MKNKKSFIVATIFVLFFSLISFYAGYKYSQGRKSVMNFGPGTERGGLAQGDSMITRQGERQGNINQNQVIGEIIKKDDNSITVKTGDASSVIIYLKEDIFVGKMAEVGKSELLEGNNVLILGSKGADSSFIAESIQIR